MSNNAFVPINLNDAIGYSAVAAESDFEIINNYSDCEETELNNCCYQKLNNDHDQDNICYCSDCTNYCNSGCCNSNASGGGNDACSSGVGYCVEEEEKEEENYIKSFSSYNNNSGSLFFDSPPPTASFNKYTTIIKDNNQLLQRESEKLVLNLSQDQISRIEKQHQQKQQQQQQLQLQDHQQNFDRACCSSENVLVNRTRARTFTTPFTIVPIDISKNNKDRCKTEKTDLPEIVLTSFENNPLSAKFDEKSLMIRKPLSSSSVPSSSSLTTILQQQQQQHRHKCNTSTATKAVTVSTAFTVPSASAITMGLPARIKSSAPIAATATAAATAITIPTQLQSQQIHQIHRIQNSPSPELLLDRTLSNESIHDSSLSNDAICNSMNGCEDILIGNNCNTAAGLNGDNGVDSCDGDGIGSNGVRGIDTQLHFITDTISPLSSSSSSSPLKKPLNLERPLKQQQQQQRQQQQQHHQLGSININDDSLHHSSSPSNSISGRGLDQLMLHESKEPIPNDLKCRICGQIYKDPRTLNCLHSFCFQCLINENFIKDISIPFWSRPDHKEFDWTSISNDNINNGAKSTTSNKSANSSSVNDSSRPESRSSRTSSFVSKKSSDKQSKDKSSKSSPKKHSQNQQQQQQQQQAITTTEKIAIIICTICKFCTEMPVGGIRQLPQNFVLIRKIENIFMKIGNDVISNIWCSLCCAEITAAYHCLICTINLCNFCKQAHERQKSTSDHNIKHLFELRKLRISQKNSLAEDTTKHNIRCSLHPGFDLKAFCITCQQIICSDCTILLHKGHKCEAAHKAFKIYQKAVKDTIDRTRPLCEYAAHSITKLDTMSVKINKKCDQVQNDVEKFMAAYYDAIETHRKILFQQVARARETKIQMILEHQFDMEKKASEAKDAVTFCEELLESGNEVEILSFVNILLKRFDYCQKFKPLLDPKISDTLHFLPEIRAPAVSAQKNIPLYGIITTQIADPQFCTLETEGYTQIRVHKTVELVIVSRDADDVPLCHGGLIIYTQLKYKDSSKLVDNQVSDKRDGTYVISFIPDSPGAMSLVVTIDNKHIKGSPFTLIARTVRPHRGIFHCCTFCSSKGSKNVSCACEGTMPGFKGCGHGHNGHPGRRHWSCCGSVLENSECSVTNKF